MLDLTSVVRQPPRGMLSRLTVFAGMYGPPQLRVKHMAGGRSNGFAPAEHGNSCWIERLLR
jgi:hypothetical protein